MTVLVVEQPNYIPWMGYFDLLDRSDIWVWYDDVQYTRRDWRNRNRVARAGEAIWLTIPVSGQDHRDKAIGDVEIDHGQRWVRKHLGTLRHFYGSSPFFRPVFDLVRRHLEAAPRLLADLTIALNEDLCEFLGIETEFHRSSELVGSKASGQRRILAICRQFRPSVYLSGPAARGYLVPREFEMDGIELRYISYRYPGYPRNDWPRRTDLSILDVLFWNGPDATLALIRRGREDGFSR